MIQRKKRLSPTQAQLPGCALPRTGVPLKWWEGWGHSPPKPVSVRRACCRARGPGCPAPSRAAQRHLPRRHSQARCGRGRPVLAPGPSAVQTSCVQRAHPRASRRWHPRLPSRGHLPKRPGAAAPSSRRELPPSPQHPQPYGRRPKDSASLGPPAGTLQPPEGVQILLPYCAMLKASPLAELTPGVHTMVSVHARVQGALRVISVLGK